MYRADDLIHRPDIGPISVTNRADPIDFGPIRHTKWTIIFRFLHGIRPIVDTYRADHLMYRHDVGPIKKFIGQIPERQCQNALPFARC